jgi:parallel beta-helix repeat protein
MHSKFVNNKADAYDLDFSEGFIVGNIFEKNGNDGIDCGTAHPTISDNRIFYCGDKGISIGEKSHPLVEDNLIAYCKVGIAIKDHSCPEIRNNEFQFNEIGVRAYQKKKVFGGAKVKIHGSRFLNNERVFESDKLSSISLKECLCNGNPCVE